MRPPRCLVARLAVLTVVACGSLSATRPAEPRVEPVEPTVQREVRIRKLHLVRPDLIPYPIAFEVYC